MIIPDTPRPTLWPPKTISSDKQYERLDRALMDLMKEDQWIDDSIKRFNTSIEGIVRKRWSTAALAAQSSNAGRARTAKGFTLA
jgi:hypothetical protein